VLLKQTHPDPERAIVLLERALALPSTGYEDDVAAVRFALARALTMAGRDPARAHRLALQARDTYEKNANLPAEKQNLTEVEAWLAKN
jgi:2-phosphoglycerate kinase